MQKKSEKKQIPSPETVNSKNILFFLFFHEYIIHIYAILYFCIIYILIFSFNMISWIF